MFGLEKKKEEVAPAFLFDLERDLVKDEKKIELIKRLESRINKIKTQLKDGSPKEVYDLLGTLLNGYHALAVVLSRASKNSPKESKQEKK